MTSSPGQRAVDVDDGELLLVVRQPILDRQMQIVGYRVAYAIRPDGLSLGADRVGAVELFDRAFRVIGLQDVVGESVAHMPVSRILLAAGVPPIDPDHVVLRLSYEDASTPILAPALETLAARGCRLELDGVPGPDFDVALLDRFDSVEIDVSRWNLDDAAAVLPAIAAANAISLASNVADHEQHAIVKELGFDRFVGPFYLMPNLIADRSVPVGSLGTLVEMCRLQSEDTPLEELVALIEHDVGLSVRLLRYINSAYFGLAARVDSIRHAAVMLGSRGVAQWALTVALVNSSDKINTGLAVIALTRADLCRQLSRERVGADPDTCFTVGLLSTADALLDLPIERVVAELPLGDVAADALLHRSGLTGQILDAVLTYEQGDFEDPALASRLLDTGRAYPSSLRKAVHAVSALLRPDGPHPGAGSTERRRDQDRAPRKRRFAQSARADR